MKAKREQLIGQWVYIASLNRALQVLDYNETTCVVVVSPRYTNHDDRQGFKLGVEASVCEPPAPVVDTPPTQPESSPFPTVTANVDTWCHGCGATWYETVGGPLTSCPECGRGSAYILRPQTMLAAPIEENEAEVQAATLYTYRCKYCGDETTISYQVDSLYCDAARRQIEVALINVTPHRHRATVIDRALAKGVKIVDADVTASQTLREVALDFVASYRGHNTFVQDIAVRLADRGTLSVPQMRGALNVMIAEARIERAELATRALDNVAVDQSDYEPRGGAAAAAVNRAYVNAPDIASAHAAAMAVKADPPAYLDLRSSADKQREDAADAMPANEATPDLPVIPNGTYTIILSGDNPDTAYRTLRVTDAPAHFTVKPGTQIISYLNGPDNSNSYKAFAFLTGARIGVWKSFKQAAALIRAADMLIADPMQHARAYVLISKKCFVCNRPLTTPQSIKAGIGPICAERIGAMGYRLLMGTRDAAIEDNDQRDAARQRAQREIDELFD